MARTRRGSTGRRSQSSDDAAANGNGGLLGQVGLFETANGLPHGPTAILLAIAAAVVIYPIARLVRSFDAADVVTRRSRLLRRQRYPVGHGTGDRHETEANDLTELAARPLIPTGIVHAGVVAIGRRIAATDVAAIGEALVAGGVRAFELTLNEPEADALRAIETAARIGPTLGLEIGAGTVLSIHAAGRAIDAGATFLVMPHLDEELVAWAAGRGIPTLPGCATPTEAFAAWRAGAAAVKLFPASSAGPAFVRELRGPFPEIPLVPTGGVTLETAAAFIAAGAVAIGMGGWLLGDGGASGIRDRAAAVVSVVAAARQDTAR